LEQGDVDESARRCAERPLEPIPPFPSLAVGRIWLRLTGGDPSQFDSHGRSTSAVRDGHNRVVEISWRALRFREGSHQGAKPSPFLDRLGCPIAVGEIAISRTAGGTWAQPAVQAASSSAAYGRASARSTCPRLRPAPRRVSQVSEPRLDALVRGVDLNFFGPLRAPTPRTARRRTSPRGRWPVCLARAGPPRAYQYSAPGLLSRDV